MGIYFYFFLIMNMLLLSCNREIRDSEFFEIPVDIDLNTSLALSEIAEEIIAIELELTDESLMNPERIRRILFCDENIIIAEQDEILVFNRNGKFVRTIGSKGQGVGEYTGIKSIAVDSKNKHLYVLTYSQNKIICYDLTGNFIKEKSQILQNASIMDINYSMDELLLLAEHSDRVDENKILKHSALYHLNHENKITDSTTIRKAYYERPVRSRLYHEDFILAGNSNLYIYYPEIYPNPNTISMQFQANPAITVLRDTLYRFEENHLIPELKLKFNNNGIDSDGNKFIDLYGMYRSTRYIFAMYRNNLNNNFYHFCYDTKTGQGYNIQDGYTDDINKIEKQIDIYPFCLDTEVFYYWHTHMNPNDLEEPNPTLYIAKLKK